MRATIKLVHSLHRQPEDAELRIAGVAHELRNCLGSIRNAAQLLIVAPNEPAARAVLGATVDRQVAQMARVIDDLMSFSCSVSGRLELNPGRVDLCVVAGEAVASIEPAMRQRRQRLAVSLPPAPLWLDADAGRLGQIFVNLLSNAEKYTDTGGDISLTLEKTDNWAVARVSDSGIGITPELLPVIFEPFVQARSALTRCEKGVGLGLAVVKALVEQHGGRVAATSAGTGKGSQFTVHLPTARGSFSAMRR